MFYGSYNDDNKAEESKPKKHFITGKPKWTIPLKLGLQWLSSNIDTLESSGL